MDLHGLVAALKQIILETGKIPNREEFATKITGAHKALALCGGYKEVLKAAGIDPHVHFNGPQKREMGKDILFPGQKPFTDKLIREYKSLCAKVEKIQGFYRHVVNLEELFARAGNPPSLKVSAQPDTHAKFMDRQAVDCYLKFLAWYQPDVHIILGDFVDCEGLSHWEPDDLKPRRLVPEMKTARDLLSRIVELTPKCSTRIYLEGNHEHWIEKALCEMPELFEGLAELDIEINLNSLLALKKFHYELFPLNHLVQIGKAHFTHGIYTPAHHAKKHLDTFKTNIYYGHLHDTQETNQTSVDGPMEAASLGCLCRLDAKFLKGRPNNWVHAHGVFEFFPDGTYTFMKVRIINGRMSFAGQIFSGATSALTSDEPAHCESAQTSPESSVLSFPRKP